MEALIALLTLVVLALAALLWGADSRQGMATDLKPPRWYLVPRESETRTTARPAGRAADLPDAAPTTAAAGRRERGLAAMAGARLGG
jgi:hypothetical protein